jgi:hypothetical protein
LAARIAAIHPSSQAKVHSQKSGGGMSVHIDELHPETRAKVLQQIEGGTTALAIIEDNNQASIDTLADHIADQSSQLANLDRARQMLAECRTLPEIKKIRDIAEAAKVYAKAANLGHESQNYAAEIALLAARKAGEILTDLERAPAGRPKIGAGIAPISPYQKTIEETQTPERTAQRWQELAAVPQETFTKYLESVRPTEDISAAGLLKAAKPPHVPKPTDDLAIQTAQRLQDDCRKVGLNVDVSLSRDPGKFHITYRNLSEAEIQQPIDTAKKRRTA